MASGPLIKKLRQSTISFSKPKPIVHGKLNAVLRAPSRRRKPPYSL